MHVLPITRHNSLLDHESDTKTEIVLGSLSEDVVVVVARELLVKPQRQGG